MISSVILGLSIVRIIEQKFYRDKDGLPDGVFFGFNNVFEAFQAQFS